MLKYPVLLLLGFYKTCISPLLPPACRFTPTCSEYMADAVRHRGAIRGMWMGIRRLARCQPFGGSGYDPVPGAPERAEYAPAAPESDGVEGRESADAATASSPAGRTEAAG